MTNERTFMRIPSPTLRRSALIAGTAALAVSLAACSSDDNTSGTARATSASDSTAELTTVPAPAPYDMSQFAALPDVPAGPATVDCTYPSTGNAAREVSAPQTSSVPAQGNVEVALETSSGPIGLELDRAGAPCTTNSFVSLAEQGYFDDTSCHRLVYSSQMQILQCGDPSATGRGGPGYGFDNEYPTTTYDSNSSDLGEPMVYPRGTIAMANSGQPGSNGSQFFLVFADTVLPPQYTVFGTIDEAGLQTIESVAVYGDDGSMAAGGGAPAKAISITKATVGS